MPRKMTKATAEERRASAAPSGPLITPDATREAVVTSGDRDDETHAATSEPGTAVARGNPSDEARPSHYEVVHAAVGGHYKGERVEAGTFTDEQRSRLLKVGAIIPIFEAD